MNQIMTNMENNIYCSCKFEMPYIMVANFKEKEIILIKNIISGSRINDLLSFGGYGYLFFDEEDNKHWNPHIQILDGFTRNKTNLMILNIKDGFKYDKIFIYQTSSKDNSFYGMLCYNESTQKSLHIFNIEYDWPKLIIILGRVLQNNKI